MQIAEIEERSFVAALLWMTAKDGGARDGRLAAEPDRAARGRNGDERKVRSEECECGKRTWRDGILLWLDCEFLG